MGYILGIDQGGTKTYAAVMDLNGHMMGCYRTDGCYFPHAGIKAASHVMAAASEKVLKDASITMKEIDIIVAGVTGIDWDGDHALVSDALKKYFGNKEIVACNDCEIAYYSGALKPVGAVICAGTGINAALFAPDGQKFVLGDYLKHSIQGGTAIASRSIEAVFESDLGVLPETALTQLFLDFSDETSVFALLKRYMTDENFSREIISLVPQIIEIADKGDRTAQQILTAFSDELAACFAAAMEKMHMTEQRCDIVLAGSVFMGPTNGLTVMLAKKLLQCAKNARIINARFEPIVGACILGILKKTGNFDDRMLQNITDSAEKLGLLRLSPDFN